MTSSILVPSTTLGNYYHLQGVRSNAYFKEINEVCCKLPVRWHPNKNLPSKEAETFRLLSEAYEVLPVAKNRSMYDFEVYITHSQ